MHRMITMYARPRQTDRQTDRRTDEHHGSSALKQPIVLISVTFEILSRRRVLRFVYGCQQTELKIRDPFLTFPSSPLEVGPLN